MSRLFQITLPHACFGIEATDGIVTLAAPIAKWMLGKSLVEIKPWLLKQKAKVTEIK